MKDIAKLIADLEESWGKGDPHMYYEMCTKGLQALPEDTHAEQRFALRFLIAKYCLAFKPHEGLQDAKAALEIAKQLGQKEMARAYWLLAQFSGAEGLQYAQLALQLANDSNDLGFVSSASYILALKYREVGDFGLAMNCAQTGYALANIRRDKFTALCILARVSLQLRQWNTALQFVNEAKEIGADTWDEPDFLTLMGTCLGRIGKEDAALELFQKALTLAKLLGKEKIITTCHHNIGVSLSHLERYEEALAYSAEACKKEKNDPLYNLHLARVLINLSKLAEAKKHLDIVGGYYKDLQAAPGLPSYHSVAALWFATNRDYAKAYYHLNIFKEITEKLRISDAAKAGDTLLQLVNLEKEKRMTEMQKLRAEHAEKELANTTIHLATQTELLGNFRNDLRQIVREIDEPIETLKKIKEKLKTLPCEQIDWMKFEKQFIEVHPEFRAKLIEQYPDLTKQEVKMCQLARLGLKNIEIAQLLCLSERSVETHRFNLRKKLGLKKEQNLAEFLATIR